MINLEMIPISMLNREKEGNRSERETKLNEDGNTHSFPHYSLLFSLFTSTPVECTTRRREWKMKKTRGSDHEVEGMRHDSKKKSNDL